MKIDALRPLIHRAVTYGFVLSVLCFILASSTIFPTTLQELLGERAAHYLPFVVLILASGTLFLGLLEYLLLPLPVSEGNRRDRASLPRAPVTLLSMLAALIFLQVLSQIPAPLHWEDHFHLSNILVDPLTRFNPLIKTEHHTIASVATYLSVHALGVTPLGVKLPAVIYTSLLLITTVAFIRRQTSLAVGSSVLLAVGANQMAIWYMHSMRGYIPAMFLCMVLFFQFREAARNAPPNVNRFLVGFVAVCYLTTLTHLFSTLFSMIGVLALLLWAVTNLSSLSLVHRRFVLRLVSCFVIFVLPVYGFVLFFQAMWLERLGDFFKGGFPAIGPSLLQALGISFEWGGRLILAFLTLSLALRFSRERWTRDFSTWFAAITFLLFWIVLSVLQIRLVETRFLLPFLAPFLIWAFESVEQVKNPAHRRLLWSVGLIAFVGAPLASRSAIYEHQTLSTRDYVQFMKTVSVLTAPVKDRCYTFSGEPNLVYFSETLYLGAIQGAKSAADCLPQYHVWFESPPDLKPIDSRPDHLKALRTEPFFNLDDRMILSRYPGSDSSGLP